MQLTTSLIRLGATPRDKNEAIRQVAALLAENGKVAPEYVEGMFAREAQENTYLGNGVAIPHGTPQSRHLIKETAIAPWEGASEIYRDCFAAGGIPETLFTNGVFSNLYSDTWIEDPVAMIEKYPLMNDYWASKIPALGNITVPAYIVASWTNLLHTKGTFNGWNKIASQEKWLRVHDRHEWVDYYDPQNVEDLRRFFDHYLKGADNGWQATPKVRLDIMDPTHGNIRNRAENEFPLARQQTQTYFLAEGGRLNHTLPAQSGKVEYQADGGKGTGASFRLTFGEETELTGYFSLKLWIEAQGNDDADLFAFVRKRGADGKAYDCSVVSERSHPGPNGRQRVSLRALDEKNSTPLRPVHLFTKQEKLRPEEIVPVEIEFAPYGIRWEAGETLELFITGTDLFVRPEFAELPPIPTLNKGKHIIHFGGQYDSCLRVPLVSGK